MSRQELRSTGGNCQGDTGRNRAAQLEIVKQIADSNHAAQQALITDHVTYGADHVTDHALISLLSYTDHVPLEAINKELSRHESNSQQAIIMELSCEESCCSAGNNQAAEQAGITQHSWQLSSR
ncbi:unnamed protein product [Ceratitis capitata]|uniref:(Mediterranean fruit fly) hypothetical protein n=1 Tax=Ceratitis capitata TaxID=7213 RepID=A0A811V8A6_CERCA|nr:unnamed protein product [Ceratitis capitata]